MTADATPRIKITYATLRADNEELHAGFEAAVARVRAALGAHQRNYVNGVWRDGVDAFEVRSPIDSQIAPGHLRDRDGGGRRRRGGRRARRAARLGRGRRGRSGSRSCGGPPS